MSTPFDRPIVPASIAQLNYIASMLPERDTAGQPEKYIGRASALRMAIKWATDIDGRPERASEIVAGVRDAGEAVNVILAEVGEGAEPEDDYLWAPLTRSGASTMIDWLTTLPRKDRVERAKAATQTIVGTPNGYVPSADVVPAGRYAMATEDGAINELAFYKIDRPTAGKWAGYVFVKHLVGDDEQRMSHRDQQVILRRIAEVGADQASAMYGLHIGECGVCGRTLTNDESRARGIGPKCAQTMGW